MAVYVIPGPHSRVKKGSTIVFTAGPFYDSAGALVDFSSGWDVTLHWRGPNQVNQSVAAGAGDLGYLEYISGVDEFVDLGLHHWTLEAVTSGVTEKRYGDDGSFVMTDVLP